MKVLYFTSTFPRNEHDTEDPWQAELVQRLSRSCELTVIAPSYRGLKSHRWRTIPVRRFRYLPSRWEDLTHGSGASVKARTFSGKIKSLFYLAAGWSAVHRHTLLLQPDVIHIHWPVPHALFAWPNRPAGTKLVLHFYGAELALARRYRWAAKLLHWAIDSADSIIAISSATADELNNWGARAVRVIPYGPSCLPPLPANEAPPRTRTLLFVGRLVERKGLGTLLHAFSQFLSEGGHGWKLQLVGEGPQRAQLENLAGELGITAQLTFSGRIADEQLQRAYAAASIFVLPSQPDQAGETEGLGVVLLEAMLNRVPIIASATGGISDIVTHGETGLLIKPGSSRQLCAEMLHLSSNAELRNRLADNGERLIADRFSWKAVTENILRLYAGTG